MVNEEGHEENGGRVKSIVFGGLDGILTAFAVVAGAVGAQLSPEVTLAMGISNVLADALSMGAGEYLSAKAFNNYVQKEYDRELWELENYPEGEVAEMVELFEQRGMSKDDAQEVIKRMAKYKTFFVDIMMREELSLPVPEENDTMESLKDGFVMFFSFAFFGMVPILGFVIVPMLVPGMTLHELFASACIITALALFGLGAFKAHFHDKRYLRSGAETTLLGGACAMLSFIVARLVADFAAENLAVLYAV